MIIFKGLSVAKNYLRAENAPLKFKEHSPGGLVVWTPLIQKKKKKISRNGHLLSLLVICCHSLSLVVPPVVTCCTTLWYSLSLFVIRCYSMAYDCLWKSRRVVHRVTTNGNEWKRVVQRMTANVKTSDNERQWMTTSDNKRYNK